MENNLNSILAGSESVLILLPVEPDFDQVAAGLSLYLSLAEKKNVEIVSPSPMTVSFNRLVGVNKIKTETGNKNLTIKFNNYPAENIERVSADVIGSQFTLTVIPKNGAISPQKENVELGFIGTEADLVFLIGGESEEEYPFLAKEDLGKVKIIHIGITPLRISSGKTVMTLSGEASSLSEIVAFLIKEMNLQFDADIATNLLAGIEEGSGNFKGPGVTANTFEAMAYLLRAGGLRNKEKKPNRNYPPGAIPGAPIAVSKPFVSENKTADDNAPKDWFEPKIYKGTSV